MISRRNASAKSAVRVADAATSGAPPKTAFRHLHSLLAATGCFFSVFVFGGSDAGSAAGARIAQPTRPVGSSGGGGGVAIDADLTGHPADGVPCQIIVESLYRSITIDARSTHTVGAVKAMVYDKDGVPSFTQRLKHVSRDLNDSRTLASYGITTGATVAMDIRGQALADPGAIVNDPLYQI